MSLEYAIEYPCEMRRLYGEQTLRALGRAGSLVSQIVDMTLKNDRPPSEESIRFTTELSEELEISEQVAEYCRTRCPAHIEQNFDYESGEDEFGREEESLRPSQGASGGETIGCLGRIRYPIEARFERFLADRAQLLSDTLPQEQWPNLFLILVDPESPFDGEVTKELRRVTTPEGLRFFEMRTPISLARKTAKLTSDNLFDLLAGFAASDDGVSGYQRELPAMALSDYAEFLEALLINGLTTRERARLHSQGSTYSQFIRFTRAVRLAESLGVRLLMD
ncbi:MAG TPA: hypothetical protein VFV58_15410 [Blastocatellia bacterium]|jgi:hypothetical protein|nr:hypothetical protein [Blastocatellia bacterium]